MKKIFSGKDSEELWKDINAVTRKNIKDFDIEKLRTTIWKAFYHLGCKCQELESRLEDVHDNKED